jgi:hypothetical protein
LGDRSLVRRVTLTDSTCGVNGSYRGYTSCHNE